MNSIHVYSLLRKKCSTVHSVCFLKFYFIFTATVQIIGIYFLPRQSTERKEHVMHNLQSFIACSGVARIFSGGRPSQLRAITSHPGPGVRGSGGPGAAAARMVEKFKILKQFKVLENESIFKEFQHFSARKSFFKNLRKIEDILENFQKFSKNLF